MSTNNKGRAPGKDATPKITDSQNHIANDELIGWFNLAKLVRNRPQKRRWQRGGRK